MSNKKTNAERVQYLLTSIVKSKPEEINCDEAQELVDQYIELEISGAAIPPELCQLKEHLEWCGCCQQVVEAIKAAIAGCDSEP